MAARLRGGLNSILRRLDTPGVAYGQSSGFHLLLGLSVPDRPDGDVSDPGLDPLVLKRGLPDDLATALQCGMLLEGVHLFRGRGLLSTAHTTGDIDQTLEAFEKTLRRMRGEGLL